MSRVDSKLYVVMNGQVVLEYDRSKAVPGQQRRYLDNMDVRMDEGIQLADDFIKSPNPLQRSQFVANSLVNALLKEDNAMAVAMCTYLGKRLPELQQIKCEGSTEDDKGISIEFVYDRSYEQAQQEQPVQFYKPEKPVQH